MKASIKAAASALFNLVYPDPEGKEPTTRQLVAFYLLFGAILALLLVLN